MSTETYTTKIAGLTWSNVDALDRAVPLDLFAGPDDAPLQQGKTYRQYARSPREVLALVEEYRRNTTAEDRSLYAVIRKLQAWIAYNLNTASGRADTKHVSTTRTIVEDTPAEDAPAARHALRNTCPTTGRHLSYCTDGSHVTCVVDFPDAERCPKTGRSASVCIDTTHAACPDNRPQLATPDHLLTAADLNAADHETWAAAEATQAVDAEPVGHAPFEMTTPKLVREFASLKSAGDVLAATERRATSAEHHARLGRVVDELRRRGVLD